MDDWEDDPSVGPETALFRRVHPRFVVPDENRDCNRISTGAFNDREMSVLLGDELERLKREPGTALSRYPKHFLAGITARAVREEQQVVVRKPDEYDDAHGLVVGQKPRGRRRRFCSASWWTIAPPNPCDPPDSPPENPSGGDLLETP